MTDRVELPPYRAAALAAPAVDRVFVGAMTAGRDGGGAELSQRYGGPAASGFLVEFRTRLAAPGGVVGGPDFAAVTRYRDPVECQRVLDKQVAHGMIHRTHDGGFGATDRGAAFLAEVYDLHAVATGRLWSGQATRVARLVDAVGRLLAAAVVEGDGPGGADGFGADAVGAGRAFAAMAPPYEPDGTPPTVLLLNRLSTLRYHRADAHAAAWTAAGHTPSSIAGLAPGPERLAIQLETDRRAAGPYAVLAAEQRLDLLADLAALPG